MAQQDAAARVVGSGLTRLQQATTRGSAAPVAATSTSIEGSVAWLTQHQQDLQHQHQQQNQSLQQVSEMRATWEAMPPQRATRQSEVPSQQPTSAQASAPTPNLIPTPAPPTSITNVAFQPAQSQQPEPEPEPVPQTPVSTPAGTAYHNFPQQHNSNNVPASVPPVPAAVPPVPAAVPPVPTSLTTVKCAKWLLKKERFIRPF